MKVILLILIIFSRPIFSSEETLNIDIININPFGIEDEKSTQKGIHYDYFKEVMRRINKPFKLAIKPYPRVINSLLKSEIHLTMVYKQNSFPKEFELCKSIGFKNFIISSKNSPISSLNDLKNKSIGIIRNAKYEDHFDNDNSIKKIELKNYLQGLKMLDIDRLDGLAISEPAYKYFARARKNKYAQPLYLNTKYNYIYGSKLVSTALSEEICSINSILIKNNILDNILKSY